MATNLQGSSHRPRAVGFRLRNRKDFIYEAIELVSASAVTDIYYVLRRETKDVKETVSQLQRLRSLIGILPVTESDIDIALSRGWKDFEDAVQYTIAESNHIDYIISRNTKDFEESEIPCVDPVDFIENIFPKLK